MNGGPQPVPFCLFTQIADKSVSDTDVETTLFGAGVGNLNLPAGFLTPGRTLRVRLQGKHSADASPPTLTIAVRLGSILIGTTAAITDRSSSNEAIWIDVLITCRSSGVSGSVQVIGEVEHHESAVGDHFGIPATLTTINTNSNLALSVTAKWSFAEAAANVTITNAIVDVLN
jgi:hypothetical protein